MREKSEKIWSCAQVLLDNLKFGISRHCFEDDAKEMYKLLNARAERGAIAVSQEKPFEFPNRLLARAGLQKVTSQRFVTLLLQRPGGKRSGNGFQEGSENA